MSSISTASVTVPVQQLIDRLKQLGHRDFLDVEKPLALLRANPVDAESLAPYTFWNASITPATSFTRPSCTSCSPSVGKLG